jgi:hypothetical protein
VKWFRFYSEVLHDPKVLRLSDREFRAWVLVLCAACEGDGSVSEDDLPIHLRQKPSAVERVIGTLKARGFFECAGTGITPHNWQQRQYKSDVSTERVRRFRDRSGNVSETPPETETDQRQIRTETEAPKRRRPLKAIEGELPDLELAFPDVNIDGELAKFMDYLKAKNKKYTDYVAAFRNWLRNAQTYQQERSNGRIQNIGQHVGRGAGVTPTTADITAGWELEAARKG